MTPTQLIKDEKALYEICRTVEKEFKMGGLADGLYGDYAREVARRYAESKLKAVEVTRGLENFKIAMEEIEKARDEATGKDWYVQDDELVVKKGSYVIYRINLKSNKLKNEDD